MGDLRVILEKVENLKGDLSATKVVGKHEGYGGWFGGKTGNTYEPSGTIYDYGDDTETRNKARMELQSLIENPNMPQIVRYDSARALGSKADSKWGYYPLKILAIKHPITTTLTGIAIAGTTAGLIYALAEYFSK